MNNSDSNPFIALISAALPDTDGQTTDKSLPINLAERKINSLIEQVFKISVDRNPKKGTPLIFMEEIAQDLPKAVWNLEILEHALFERLLMQTPGDFLIPNKVTVSDNRDVVERKVIVYLYESYRRNEQFSSNEDAIKFDAYQQIKALILRNLSTAIKQPDLFEGQQFSNQFLTILQEAEDLEIKGPFLSAAVREVLADGEASDWQALRQIFNLIFMEISKKINSASMITLEKWILPALMLFVCDKTNPKLGELLLDFTCPPAGSDGMQYANTLIGHLLRLSILPKNQNGPYEYYDSVVNARSPTLNASLWSYLKQHLDSLHLLFKGFLLMGGEVRNKLLTWIGNCLHANVARGQIWSAHNPASMLGNIKSAPDSFMFGLTGVLLRLCQPLLKPQLKVLLVDPTYCAVPSDDRLKKGVHMIDVFKETCLCPIGEGETRATAETYNFVTECFFMTHKAIDLSYRVCTERFIQMSREVNRLQNAYNDAVAQNGSEAAQNIIEMLESKMPQVLCLQNTFIEPTNDKLLLNFHEASAIWLSQFTVIENFAPSDKLFAPQTSQPIQFPLKNPSPTILKSIPEFIVENIVCYLTFMRNFESQSIDTEPEAINSLFTLILIFMGNSERARNPHLRARLAEGLESLLPSKTATNGFRSSMKAALFTTHPNRLELVENLLSVFVGIEVTGQSVQFEQKFNYRRPMYIIMEYLWNIDEQQQCFKRLATEAEQNMEAVDPPIFLRFINLLINDAIFLLDESLSNLQQIRTLQHAQDNGDWANLPANERQQNVNNLQHLGMMARFDNILGRDTINILKLLTSKIDGIFCHGSMVERVAAMLNYFLLNLVGPNKGNFKVKDKKEFEFDPANTVLEICRIYINLEKSDTFCLAVSQDGRSYSPGLFKLAEAVLIRICGGQLIGEISDFAIKVHRLEQLEIKNQEALADAPDEFLDPIMSTLMLDPVILPSSNVTVDRTTIARHLLSDQSDPFNRSPLTMDQVQTDQALKAKIEEWMREKRAAYKEATKMDE